MKQIFIGIFICLLMGCNPSSQKVCKKGLPEKHYDFLIDIKRQPNFDYLETIVDFRQFGSSSKNLWIRKAKNLELVYASLKKIGLKKFISKEEFDQLLFTDHWKKTSWENKSLNQITENLILSYVDTTGFDEYYIQFWNRRKNNNNDSIVFKILKDISTTYKSDENSNVSDWKDEPILTKLLDFEIKLKHSDSSKLKEINSAYFNYLKEIELYSSATNLIQYQNEILMNESEIQDDDYIKLIKQIETDSVSCEMYWNWRQNSQWFLEIYDYGI